MNEYADADDREPRGYDEAYDTIPGVVESQSTELQPNWVAEHTIVQNRSQANYDVDAVREALADLVEDGVLEERDGRYRVAEK